MSAFRSTRARLLLLLALVAAAVVGVAALALRMATVAPSVAQFSRMIEAQVTLAETLLRAEPLRAPEALARAGLMVREAPPEDQPLPRLQVAHLVAARLAADLGRERLRFRVGSEPEVWVALDAPGRPWLGVPIEALAPRMRGAVFWTLLLGTLIVIAAAVWLGRALTRPIERLAAAAPALLAGDRSAVARAGFTRELAQLADALGAAAESRNQALSARERVLAEVSHDLRTPLQRLRLALELGDAAEPGARAAMGRDLDELEALVAGALAWLRDGREEAAVPLDLAALLAEVVAAFRRREPALELSAPAAAPLDGKPLALKRAVGNLLDNALTHGAPPIHVTLETEALRYVVRVADSGGTSEPAGSGGGARVPPDAASGHRGLGLSIVRAVAAAHGGTVVLSERAEGCVAELALARAPPAGDR